jgi:hypothetical protein
MVIYLSFPDPGFLLLMGSMGLALGKVRILLRVLSDIFSWALILLRGT